MASFGATTPSDGRRCLEEDLPSIVRKHGVPQGADQGDALPSVYVSTRLGTISGLADWSWRDSAPPRSCRCCDPCAGSRVLFSSAGADTECNPVADVAHAP